MASTIAVSAGHHRLPTQHAAAVHVLRRHRQREFHFAGQRVGQLQADRAHPGRECVACEQRLQRRHVDVDVVEAGDRHYAILRSTYVIA